MLKKVHYQNGQTITGAIQEMSRKKLYLELESIGTGPFFQKPFDKV